MTRHRRRAALLFVLSGLALAACGGGVSKEDYAQDLDEVCSDLEEKTEDIGDTQATSAAQVSDRLEAIRTAVRDSIERMKDLERPDGDDGETAEEFVNEFEKTANEQLLPALDELAEAFQAKDRVKMRAAATRLQAIDAEKSEDLARDLGVDECAEG